MGPLAESVLPMLVWPNDLDLNGHMNNGRYLTVMDLGRLDLIIRTGLLGQIRRERWAPVLGGAIIRYRRSLQPFQRYAMHTRIRCWDDKWVYIEQRFVRKGHVVAVAYNRGVFKQRGRTVAPAEILVKLGIEAESPPMPAAVKHWIEAEDRLVDEVLEAATATAPGIG